MLRLKLKLFFNELRLNKVNLSTQYWSVKMIIKVGMTIGTKYA